MDTHTTNLDSNTNSTKANRSVPRWLKLSGLVLVVAACSLGVYLWQHHEVNKKTASVRTLTSQVGQLQKTNKSLLLQVAKLNGATKTAATNSPSKTQTSTNPSDNDAVTIAQATSNLIINDVKEIPASTYNSAASSSATYDKVEFTIYNNSSKTQTYSLAMSDSFVKGVTASGSVVSPPILYSSMWYSSTILAGGSANGFALFDPAAGVVKLQWQAPDSSTPILLPLPSQS